MSLALSATDLITQGFGVAEGRPKEDLKNMANAAGQACRDFTPPGGETLEQVHFSVRIKGLVHDRVSNLEPPLVDSDFDLCCFFGKIAFPFIMI